MSTQSSQAPRAYPARPLLAASAAVFRDGRVLLARRAGAPRAGLWSLPGGLVEPGEYLAQAAIREVMEETGVMAETIAPADTVEIIDTEDDGRVRHHYVIVCFAACWREGEGRSGEATDAVRWLEPGEIHGLDLAQGTARAIGKAAALMGAPAGTS